VIDYIKAGKEKVLLLLRKKKQKDFFNPGQGRRKIPVLKV
jgi:hypothetical protein